MAIEDIDIRSLVTRPRVSRYDMLLAAIPAALGLSLLAAMILPIPDEFAVGAGSVVAAAAVGDGLFRHPPHRPPPA